MKIPAEVHTDCRTAEAEFDAEPWFQQASDEDILQLAECGWGGDQPADEVAEHFENEPGYENVTEIFTALHILHRKTEVGFECHIEEEKAMTWLKEHRPYLHAILLNDQEGEILTYVATTPLADLMKTSTGGLTVESRLVQMGIADAKATGHKVDEDKTVLHISQNGQSNSVIFYVLAPVQK